MKTPLIFALALVTAAPLATAAYADRTTAVGVRYGDLDLNSPADAATMLARLDDAALQACGAYPFESLREYMRAVRHSRCYARGMSRAVSQLNAPELKAMFDREYRGAD